MNKITLISDVHSNWQKHLEICSQNEYTVQMGDLGYAYSYLQLMDSDKHKFISGNHDAHQDTIDGSSCYSYPHCLGRFGYTALNNVNFFFVSGGFSLDKDQRIEFERKTGIKTYFENEELSYMESMECLDLYSLIMPDLVLTHEGPRSIVDLMFDRTKLKYFGVNPETFTTSTSELLDQMLEIHVPKNWYFGHMHDSRSLSKDTCVFRCLAELETLEITNE